jgi:hypothetical protein
MTDRNLVTLLVGIFRTMLAYIDKIRSYLSRFKSLPCTLLRSKLSVWRCVTRTRALCPGFLGHFVLAA